MNKHSDQSTKWRVAKAFGQAAASYNAAAVFQQEIGKRLIERLNFARIAAGTVMDLGASTGYLTQQLAQCYGDATLIAVDIAEGMLRYMQKSDHLSLPWLVCADAEHLPFSSETVDLVFSNLMLQWCPNSLAVFDEVRRLLKPGGLFVFSTLGPDTFCELRQSWAQVDDYQHVNAFTDMHNVGDALLTLGLRNPVVDREYVAVMYDRVADLLRDLRALGANQVIVDHRVPGFLGKGCYQAFMQAYEKFRNPEGLLPVTYEVIYGYAWKAPEIEEARVFIRDIGRRLS